MVSIERSTTHSFPCADSISCTNHTTLIFYHHLPTSSHVLTPLTFIPVAALVTIEVFPRFDHPSLLNSAQSPTRSPAKESVLEIDVRASNLFPTLQVMESSFTICCDIKKPVCIFLGWTPRPVLARYRLQRKELFLRNRGRFAENNSLDHLKASAAGSAVSTALLHVFRCGWFQHVVRNTCDM